MATNEQLEREVRRLRAIKESKQDFMKLQRERNNLRKEIKSLRNPNTHMFKKNLKIGLIRGGKETLKFLDNITRPVPVKRKPMKKKTKQKRRRR